jgi:hypothetical protein
MDDPDNHYCADIGGTVAYDVDLTPQFGVLQAIALHSKMWEQFSTIDISFMGGTPSQHKIVRDVVDEDFRPLVNLKLRFVHRGGHIRIAFMKGQGAWSALGTDARLVRHDRPTLNLGWLDDQPSAGGGNFGVVKHELGHALGAFLHEHQHPDAGYDWNREVVISALIKEPNKWDLKTIQHNMFDRYKHSEIRSTEFDSLSIMHYFFPASWTNGGVHLKSNQFLSDQDKYFLRLEYPHKTNMPISLSDPTTSPEELHARTRPPQKSSDDESKSKNNWLIGLGAVAALAALALIAIRTSRKSRQTEVKVQSL